MNINAIEELERVLDEIDAKIKHLESSPNRAFVLVEYDTLSLFHWFNLCFKQFWDEFDCQSASQLLQYQDIILTYGLLRDKYASLFIEQIRYLEGVLDFKNECVKELPPVVFSEDNHTDVIGYYKEYYKDEKDESGKPLFKIDLDCDTHSEVIDGIDIPIDFYMFRSDVINDVHYKGLSGMYKCLNNIWGLMFAVHSYMDNLVKDYRPNQDDIVKALEKELRQYAKEIEKNVERELRRTAQYLKPSRHAQLTPDVWGLIMDEEDDLYRLAIIGQLKDNEEKRFENIFDEQRKKLTDNAALLQKIMSTAIDGELFDIRLSIETHNLLSSLKADNLDLFYELVLRRNIIQREMFPDKLKATFEEWVNSSEEQQFDNSEAIPKTSNSGTNINSKQETNQEEGEESALETGIRHSLERLMQERIMVKKRGKEVVEPLFNLKNHWQGVYRILVDKKYSMDSDFDGFDCLICKVMPKNVNKPYSKESVKQISKTDFNIPFEKWKYNAETSGKRKVYERMYAVTKRFKELLEEEGL